MHTPQLAMVHDSRNHIAVSHIVVADREGVGIVLLYVLFGFLGLILGSAAPSLALYAFLDSQFEPPSWGLIIIAIGAAIGFSLGILFAIEISHLRKTRNSCTRVQRLSNLARHGALKTALPHRALEQKLLSRFPTQGRIRRFVAGLPPGVTIAVNMPRPHPASHAVPFEPVGLDVSDESLKDLVQLNLEKQGFPVNAHTLTLGFQGKKTKISKGAKWPYRLDWISNFAFLSLGVFTGTFGFGTAALILVFWAIYFWKSEIAVRQWWLVPGGVIFRKTHPWRRQTTVGMVTPDNSPLLVHHRPKDQRSGNAVVVVDGRAIEFYCPQWTAWAVLAAWISTAPRPTKEEILAFFGPDAEWAE